MKYFGPKNTLAKYIWKVLKNCSNEIRIRRGSPVCKKIHCMCIEVFCLVFAVPIFSEGFGMSVKNKPKFEECTFHKYLAFFYQSKNS